MKRVFEARLVRFETLFFFAFLAVAVSCFVAMTFGAVKAYADDALDSLQREGKIGLLFELQGENESISSVKDITTSEILEKDSSGLYYVTKGDSIEVAFASGEAKSIERCSNSGAYLFTNPSSDPEFAYIFGMYSVNTSKTVEAKKITVVQERGSSRTTLVEKGVYAPDAIYEIGNDGRIVWFILDGNEPGSFECAATNAGGRKWATSTQEGIDSSAYFAFANTGKGGFYGLESPIPPTSMQFDSDDFTIVNGATHVLGLNIEGGSFDGRGLSWSSSNESVATIDSNGTVAAIAVGTTTITAQSALNATVSATCKVTVTELKSAGVRIFAPSEISLAKGSTCVLDAVALGSNQVISWASDNDNAATVESGTINALSPGKAVISATSGTNSDSVVVNVVDAAGANAVSVDGAEYSSISAAILAYEAEGKSLVGAKIELLDNLTESALSLPSCGIDLGGWTLTLKGTLSVPEGSKVSIENGMVDAHPEMQDPTLISVSGELTSLTNVAANTNKQVVSGTTSSSIGSIDSCSLKTTYNYAVQAFNIGEMKNCVIVANRSAVRVLGGVETRIANTLLSSVQDFALGIDNSSSGLAIAVELQEGCMVAGSSNGAVQVKSFMPYDESIDPVLTISGGVYEGVVTTQDYGAITVNSGEFSKLPSIVGDGRITYPMGYTLSETERNDDGYLYLVKIPYAVNKADCENGSFAVSAETASIGDEVTVAATPDEGYVLDAIAVKDADGNEVEVSDGAFTMPASDVTVSVAFKTQAQADAEQVSALIAALPDSISDTDVDKALVADAVDAYLGLSDEARALVDAGSAARIVAAQNAVVGYAQSAAKEAEEAADGAAADKKRAEEDLAEARQALEKANADLAEAKAAQAKAEAEAAEAKEAQAKAEAAAAKPKQLVLSRPALTAKTKSAKKGKVTVAWKKVAGATGYEVKVGSKTYTVKKASTLKKVVKAKKGKKVKVQVRAFAKQGANTLYSAWSKAKKVKVKK